MLNIDRNRAKARKLREKARALDAQLIDEMSDPSLKGLAFEVTSDAARKEGESTYMGVPFQYHVHRNALSVTADTIRAFAGDREAMLAERKRAIPLWDWLEEHGFTMKGSVHTVALNALKFMHERNTALTAEVREAWNHAKASDAAADSALREAGEAHEALRILQDEQDMADAARADDAWLPPEETVEESAQQWATVAQRYHRSTPEEPLPVVKAGTPYPLVDLDGVKHEITSTLHSRQPFAPDVRFYHARPETEEEKAQRERYLALRSGELRGIIIHNPEKKSMFSFPENGGPSDS